MVNRHDEIKERKLKIGDRKVVERHRREPFELADEIVTEIADRSSEKRRNIARTSDVGVPDELSEMLEGSPSGLFVAMRLALQISIDFSAQCLIGVTGEERIPSCRRTAVAALKEKGGALSRGDFGVEVKRGARWARKRHHKGRRRPFQKGNRWGCRCGHGGHVSSSGFSVPLYLSSFSRNRPNHIDIPSWILLKSRSHYRQSSAHAPHVTRLPWVWNAPSTRSILRGARPGCSNRNGTAGCADRRRRTWVGR